MTMERQSPPKILQLKCSMYHATFVLSTSQRAPQGVLGDYPLLSMNDGYHTHGYATTFIFYPTPGSISRPGD